MNRGQNTAKIDPENYVPLLLRVVLRRKGTEGKRPESLAQEGSPCVKPPLPANPIFETSDFKAFLTLVDISGPKINI